MKSNLDSAIQYAKSGWHVLPCRPKMKTPLTNDGFKSATIDLEQIKTWWQRYPDANIAVRTGRVSNLLVLDIDCKPGLSALDALIDLETEFEKVPTTIHQITGGGGYQFFFSSLDDLPSRIGIRPNVDIKCSQGYVIVPPSIHPTGNKYEFEAFHTPDLVSLAPLPAWLRTLVLNSKTKDNNSQKSNSDWRDLTKQGARQGLRNASVASLVGHLLRKGIDPIVACELVQAWNSRNTPPLPEHEILQTIDSIARLELDRRRRQEALR